MFKVICAFTLLSVVLAAENPLFLKANLTGEYYVSLFELDFSQAFASCKRYGWSLASERTPAETAAINETLTSFGYTANHYWLSAFYQNDGEFNPLWIWLDSGEELIYKNWGSGEPTTGECMIKGTVNSYRGTWISTACTEKNYFICEK